MGGGDGGHNGLADVTEKSWHAGSRAPAPRIGHPGSAAQVVAYVLKKAPKPEQSLIDEGSSVPALYLNDIVQGEFQHRDERAARASEVIWRVSKCGIVGHPTSASPRSSTRLHVAPASRPRTYPFCTIDSDVGIVDAGRAPDETGRDCRSRESQSPPSSSCRHYRVRGRRLQGRGSGQYVLRISARWTPSPT